MSTVERFKKNYFENFDGAVLVLSPENRFYLSELDSSDGAVLLTKDMSYFLVDFRYYEIAKNTAKDFDVVLAEKSLLSKAYDICKDMQIKQLAVEDEYITISLRKRISEIFEGVNIVYLGDELRKMRCIKTDKEIQRIKSSQEITDAAFEHILGFLRAGITENDVAAELEYFMRKCGAQECAFKTICVSGNKSSLPHGEPSNIVLTSNSFLTMDFGAKLDGYCSDMTRTVVIGRADDEMKEIYNIVLKAQLAALETIHEGVIGSVVDAAARNIITNAGFGDCFGHSTGHGLGIEVHEMPSYSPNYKKEIPRNAVLSIEPGIYIEGKYGVRIEDIAVVSAENAINLTHSSKNLIEI